MAAAARRARLSCRDRAPLLLSPLSLRPRADRGEDHGAHNRAVPQGRADCGAYARIAKLRHQATPEDVDYRSHRGLDRGLFLKLVAGDWIAARDNLVFCGPTGVGKLWLACALGHKACRDDRSVLYQRVPKLFASLALARGDGRYVRILAKLGSAQLLILDDWGLEPLDAQSRHDLLEILKERYGRRSTIQPMPTPS